MPTANPETIRPYSIRPGQCPEFFGIAAQTIYGWVNEGRLTRGKHYLKVGGRLCIVVDEFINFMREEDAGHVSDH